MKTKVKSITALAIILMMAFATSGQVKAQTQCTTERYTNNRGSDHPGSYHHYRYSGIRWGYGYRVPTYDPQFGRAEILRASARANLVNAKARTENAMAFHVEMDNKLEFLVNRLEQKRINNEARFGHLHARGARVRAEKFAAAQAVAVTTRIRRPVDPVTGQVEWPMLLRHSYFEKARGPIDIVFLQRSVNGAFNPDHYLPMQDWICRIKDELNANAEWYERENYLKSRDFLDSLMVEARKDLTAEDSEFHFVTN